MFSSTTNPYDDLIAKATDEGHVEAPWGDFVEISDNVEEEGEPGARNAVLALQRQLSHRNPNVQMYALDLANYLVLNGGRTTYKEFSSRGWTGALDRLINERTTAPLVKKKALSCVKSWTKTFEETRDPNLGVMTELFDSLKAKNFSFDEPEPVPENTDDIRLRQEEEELARVLELSKQDKGGRYQPGQPAAGGSSSSAYQSGSSQSAQAAQQAAAPQQSYGAPSYQAQAAQAPLPPQEADINTATRVRALYSFATTEVGELPFERGDVIKVLDRGFKEWWRGASGGRIGIFPTTYVEAMPDPSPAELAEEAQEEAKVFASLGMVDQLLKLLKGIDPSRGDRVDDVVEIEDLYQSSVALQSQITALIKKYGDQKAELEHMNANFLRAMRSYEGLRNPQVAPAPVQAPYAPQQYAQQPYPQQAPQQQQTVPPGWPQSVGQPVVHGSPQAQVPPQGHGQAQGQGQPQGFFPQQHDAASIQPGYPPSELHRSGTEPGQAGIGAGAGQHPPAQGAPYAHGDLQQPQHPQAQQHPSQQHVPQQHQPQQQQPHDPQHAAAWEAYYRQQAQQQQQQQPQPTAHQPQEVAYGSSPYPPAHQGSGDSYADPAAGVTNGVANMRV